MPVKPSLTPWPSSHFVPYEQPLGNYELFSHNIGPIDLPLPGFPSVFEVLTWLDSVGSESALDCWTQRPSTSSFCVHHTSQWMDRHRHGKNTAWWLVAYPCEHICCCGPFMCLLLYERVTFVQRLGKGQLRISTRIEKRGGEFARNQETTLSKSLVDTSKSYSAAEIISFLFSVRRCLGSVGRVWVHTRVLSVGSVGTDASEQICTARENKLLLGSNHRTKPFSTCPEKLFQQCMDRKWRSYRSLRFSYVHS